MEIIKSSTGYPCHEVDGVLIRLTLEVMDIVSYCEINSEFYGSEREYLIEISSAAGRISRQDVSSEERAELCFKVGVLAAAVDYSRKFVKAYHDGDWS